MAYDARVYKVMIASPGDVLAEREAARDVIHEWNALHSEQRRQVLLPVGWDTHSSPEMGDRPQEIINRQVLRGCDLLVAVFWSRLGTDTGKAPSGTVEEIEEHVAAKKLAMLYFSAAAVPQARLGDGTQYFALKQFQDDCAKLGVVETFDSTANFRDKLRSHLVLKMNERFPTEDVPGSLDVGRRKEISLDPLAVEILREAAESAHRLIFRHKFAHGLQISVANQGKPNRVFTGESTRTQAHADYALRQLVHYGLIAATGQKGEAFEVTHAGFVYIDALDAEGKTP